MSSKLRIIGGEWRSRVIVFDDAPGLRPTPSRVRETLFNWLQADVMGSRCLDLFAGSGALGFEAASRGARRVVQVENNPKTCQKLGENCRALAAENVAVVQMDVARFIQNRGEPFDLIFLDPPFGQGLIQPTCRQLAETGLLAAYGKIYIEAERSLVLDGLPADWRLLKHKVAGDVSYNLFQRQ
ncbi:16S rRNA (guanine(966)-N(2))-methyltransferase RsmD [Methylomonas sp. LL1]|uniref:16S rRNA (guanine(966)-N(2))-methyltransferase RsmD n=1 Tax=Methylomonas sp. LL1 TaxID=2785785 RepID=UPI0018C39245|nr:16S rRNA (guanine(966)-N(2))-methyltransferase RsmD [Methylomonas sp. LL1]QPK62795.1 16S rRNA (guanine(966)-N(2))-methyltransferase RsmD [Methylomonas sp. LL1]